MPPVLSVCDSLSCTCVSVSDIIDRFDEKERRKRDHSAHRDHLQREEKEGPLCA